MKKKILFIVPNFNSGGGTIASLLSIVNSNLKDCFDFYVYSIYGGKDLKHEFEDLDIGLNTLTELIYCNYSELSLVKKMLAFPVKFLRSFNCWRPKLENWAICRTVTKIRQRFDFDWVVGFQEGFATMIASRFDNENKIAWIHCDYARTYPRERDEYLLYTKFNNIVCVSQFTKNTFVARYPLLKSKVLAIHNIFDESNIHKKAEMQIDDERFNSDLYTIITVGRISYVKQIYQLPAIAATLKNCGLKFRWYILGGGNEGGEKERLDVEIAKYNISECFILLGNKRNPYPYFKAADLLLTNSSSEACPMIFNEAKLLGLPIVSNNFGSAYEFLKEDEGDLIVPTSHMVDCLKKKISEGKKQKTPRIVTNIAYDQIKKLFEP